MNVDIDATCRPRLEARRRAFLTAATEVFLEKGYSAATLDDVIARSGGSRQTLYSLFGGKQGLFEALMTDRCGKIFGPLSPEDLLERPPDEVLVELGTRYLEVLTSPEGLGVYRLVISESLRMRDVAERFWELGPGRNRALLARYFERQTERGALKVANPQAAAHQFWGMLLGPVHVKCLLGLREPPDAAEIDTIVRGAVAQFLDGCRPDHRTGDRRPTA
ncbi:MAG TPA: TetR/AcrR family transcriptional regulator [Acetobacteraceae bacterium]|nr:TetR/AcrR family transcriptional regulator [Acetobacteraceae bacterium]